MTIERIEVQGREWFDKANGNSYCSAQVLVNDGLALVVPFQYGYGSAFEQYAGEELDRLGIVSLTEYSNGATESLKAFCERGYIHYSNHICSVLKRDAIAWGSP